MMLRTPRSLVTATPLNGGGGERAGGMKSIQPTSDFKMERTEMSRKCLVWLTFM